MKIIITSGGTGGHIYPALSLAKYLINNKEEVLFIGAKGRMEEILTNKEKINFIGLEVGNRNGLVNKLKFVKNTLRETKKCLKIIDEYKPQVIIGFGNYISIPICIASILKKIPLILHEQNSLMGKANYYLGYFAKKIGYSLPLMKEYHKSKLINLGNPRSEECLKITNKVDIDESENNILIFMGSLGSASINKVLIELINHNNDMNIYHVVTGKKYYEEFIKETIKKDNIHIYPYLNEMPSFMKKCDVVVTRSGATTLCEITTLGLASILIPSPYVVKNHQYYNAKYLEDNKACLMIEEKDLTYELLQSKINYLLENNEERIKLRLNSLKLAIFDSNKRIYNLIKEYKNE